MTPVTSSEWAAPIVSILKTDGTLRLCGDYKVTVNQALQPDSYPLPRVEDLFAALAGGTVSQNLILVMRISKFGYMKTPKSSRPFQLSKDCFSTKNCLSELKQHLHYFKEPWKHSLETCLTFVFTLTMNNIT